MLTALSVLIFAVALVWASRHLDIARAGRSLPPLSSRDAPPSSSDRPRVSVLVAAKDEEANIERCIRSWLRQDYPDFELIVINDRSTDRTGPIIDRLAATDRRLRPVHVTALRPGWFGKNNAMHEGVSRASGAWLCFSDADCEMTAPQALSVAMHDAAVRRVDFLSILPRLDVQSLWEQIIQPACGGIMMLWFSPLRVNKPRSRAAYANGAFMLLSRTAYDTIGGHEPVRTEVNEDVHMARRAKEAGLSLQIVPNADLYTVRMYQNFRQAWNGWSRIFYGCFGTFRRLILSLVVLCLVSLLPWVGLVSGLIGVFAAPGAGYGRLAIAGATACLLQLSVLVRFYRLSNVSPKLAPTYPLAALLAFGMLVNALRRLGGRQSTTWRGTTYRGTQVEQPAGTAQLGVRRP